MSSFRKTLNRFRSLLLILVLASWQVAGPVGSLIKPAVASAAEVCTVDTAGPNDEPGQKDLNKLCADYAGVPTSVSTKWNWDETGTNGANTMDACNLFDTDNDGNANYSVCVTTQNDPAVFQSLITYSCGDTRPDRCTSPATPISNGTTSCAITQVTNDPFPGPPNSAKGDDYPKDTQGACTIQLSTVGGASAKLVDVCSYPSGQPNSDPSDCVITRDSAGRLEVIKNLVPANDSGLFNLQIDGQTAGTGANVGNNGTTGELVYSAGNHTVGETGGTNTSLAGYTSSISCRDLNGTGAVIASGNGTSLQLNLADLSDVICIITNTASGSITITKDAQPNDAQDFGFTGTGTGITPFTLDDDAGAVGENVTNSNSKTFNGLNAGSYSFTETGVSGWDLKDIVCPGGSVQVNGATVTVTLSAGQNVNCTYTNVKRGHLIVQKTTLPAGDPTSFSINATSSNGGVVTGGGAGSVTDAADHNYEVTPGTYSVAETVPAGWDKTGDTCQNVVVAAGATVTCTITNTKLAKLTVTKVVVNDNGGTKVVSNFPLFVNGNGVTSGVSNSFAPGSYTVSETTDPGYAAVISGDCDANGSVSLAAGDVKACTITNNDIAPKLIVKKHVINDNGGTKVASDFLMNIIGTNVSNSSFPGDEAGTEVTLNAGAYSADETAVNGYAKSLSNDCAGVIALAETKTCTITNDDIQPRLTITKIVNNFSGGNALPADFPLDVSGALFNTGVQQGIDAGSYVVSETQQPGYTQTGIGGDCAANGSITLAPGDVKACTITNQDIAPTITLIKAPTNNYGTPAAPDFFGLSIDGTMVLSGVTNTVTANTPHTVNEAGLPGYSFASTTGDAKCPAVLGGSVTLDEGENITCTISNVANQPQLIVKKHVINDNGGTNDAGDFTMSVGGNSQVVPDFDGEELGTTVGLNEGNYDVTESGPAGYAASYSPDCSGSIAIGETKTCVVTNDDIAPQLKVVKVVINDDGGTKQISDFPLFVGATGVPSGATNDFNAGNYAVSETNQPGYAASFSGDCDANGNVSLAVGDALQTCTITNNDIAPTITVIKQVVSTQPDSGLFNLQIDGQTAGTGNNVGDNGTTGAVNVLAGQHSIGETAGLLTDLADYVTTFSGDCAPDGSITVVLDEDAVCTITNTRRATVVVTKYNDLNRNDQYDPAGSPAEPALPGWDILLDQTQQTTGNDGTTTFTQVAPGIHSLDEVLQDGWHQGNIQCDSELDIIREIVALDGSFLFAAPGATVNCTIGNYRDVVLGLSKSVDRPAPLPNQAGDTVTYTIVVNLPANSGVAFDTEVTDLPPENFTYVPGSWTAVLTNTDNTTVDLKATNVTTEPNYGSPGTWFLGTLLPGQFVTLTYQAVIGANVSPGTYPDLAFAKAFNSPNVLTRQQVVGGCFAACVSGLGTPFVSTAVAIIPPAASTTFNGQVLGVSTTLVETGNAFLWLQVIISLTILTLTGLLWKDYNRKGAAQ